MKRSPESVSVLQEIVKDYNSLLDSFAIDQSKKGAKLSVIQKVGNDFLQRTRINNEALVPLFEIYKKDKVIIQPIGLILRSTLSDFLTFCYLTTFLVEKEKEQTSLINELRLLECDFLKSMLEVSELEFFAPDHNPNIPKVFNSKEEYSKHIDRVKSLFSHAFKQENTSLRFKKVEEFRATSSPDFFDDQKEYSSVGGGFMSEKYKWKRIEKTFYKKYVVAFIGFKFFSQFQHYSKMSIELIDELSEGSLFYHVTLAINSMLIMTDLQIQIIDGTDSNYLPELRKIAGRIEATAN